MPSVQNIFTGRPADKRSPGEEAVYDALDALNIKYLRTDHEPAMTMEDCEETDRIMDMRACKNLFLTNKQKNRFFLVVLRGDKRFVTKELSAALSLPRLSFAPEAEMKRLLGCRPGSVSILGLINDALGEITLIVDSDVPGEEYFGCHPCMNTSSLKIRTADIFEKFLPYTGHTPIYYDTEAKDGRHE